MAKSVGSQVGLDTKSYLLAKTHPPKKIKGYGNLAKYSQKCPITPAIGHFLGSAAHIEKVSDFAFQ